MAKVVHPDPDRVYACPGCDVGGGIYRRTHQNKEYDDPIRCQKCGHTFDDDEIVDRPAKGPIKSEDMVRSNDGIPSATDKETAERIRRLRDQ